MSQEEVNVKIGAQTEGLQSGMAQSEQIVEKSTNSIQQSLQKMTTQVTGSVASMQSQMSSHFNQIGATISKVTGALIAVSAVIAGGKAFKEVVAQTIDWTGHSIKLAKQLGTTTEASSTLMVAAERMGMEVGQVDSVLKGFVRQLKSNEQGLRDMGISTTDSNGKTRNMIDIMLDANKVLLGYREGKDRDIAMMKVYGRAALDNAKFLQINTAVMEEARRRADELGMTVGEESVKQFKAYKSAQIDIKEVMHSLQIQIGTAVLPAFTQLGAWFGGVGPGMIQIFSGALKGLISFVQFVGLGLIVLYETAKSVFNRIIIVATTAAEVLNKLMHGDFKGAIEAGKNGWKELDKTGQEYLANLEKAADRTKSTLAKMWGIEPTKESKELPDAGGKQIQGGTEKEEKSRVPIWESDLEKMKELEGNFFKDSKASDLKYWQAKLDNAKLSADEQRTIQHKVFQLKGEIAKEELAIELQSLKAQSEAALSGSLERINIATQEAELIKSKYGAQSKEYAAMLREIGKMHREFEADQIKRQEAAIDKKKELNLIATGMEEDVLNFRKDLGLINDEEEIIALKQMEEQKHAIEVEAMKARAMLLKEGSVERIQALNAIEMAEAKHAAKLTQLNLKASKTVAGQWKNVFSKMVDDMELGIRAMLKGTLTWSNAWRHVMNQVLTGFISMVKRKVVTHLIAEKTKTAATAAGATAREGIEMGAHLKSIALSIWAAMKKIAIAAYEAAAGAYKALVEIPYVGPILAPIGAGVAFAAVGAYGMAVASAAGGYDVPEDQMAMIHKREMVLPAELSDKIRNMSDPGPAASRDDGAVHFHVHALDAKSVKRLLQNNGAALADTIRSQKRNFSGAFA